MEEVGKEVLLKLIEFVESASPEVWRIALQQVHVELVNTLIATLAFVFMSVVIFILWIRNDGEFSGNIVFLLSLEMVPGIFLMLLVTKLVGLYLNPEYAAIKTLIGLLTGQSGSPGCN